MILGTRHIIIMFSLMVAFTASAQVNRYCFYDQLAIEKYQEKDLLAAISAIDSAILMCDKIAKDPYAHHIKGFVNYEYFKKNSNGDVKSPYRYTAVEALLKSNELDTDNSYTTKNNKIIKNLAVRIQKAVVNNLDTNNFEKSIVLNDDFKETMKLSGSSYDISKWDRDFNLQLATVYEKKYANNNFLYEDYLNKAIAIYEDIIKLDSNNFTANQNLGYIYHNLSINIILNTDEEEDILTVIENQEKMTDYGLKSIPYLKKAYEHQPKNVKILRGLAGMYLMIQENEKHVFYQNLIQEISSEKDDSQSPPNNNN